MATEQARYTVEIREPPFEVRAYAPAVVAAVHMDGTREEAVNAGFRILARFIFGDNQAEEKIAMTAPVTQSAAQRIPMTVPVEESGARAGWEVRFTMPAAYDLTTLPKPRDPRIELESVGARRVAAVTFSGFWSDSNLQSQQARLADFLKSHELTALSSPIYAFYDPPWTPWFWRTNEVLVDVGAAPP